MQRVNVLNYYEVSLFKSPLQNLTYQSSEKLEIGTIVEVALGKRAKLSSAVIIKEVEKPTFDCLDIQSISSKYLSQDMINIAKFISTYYVCTIGEALSIFHPFDKNVKYEKNEFKFKSEFELSPKQNEAYDFCEKNLHSLLFANTGAGKTEIYIKLIEKCINEGNEALLLMPEISLTPQMEKRLKKVFGSSVAIWHSKVTKSKKDKIISGILDGSIKLVAGARSALFLPFKNLKTIIVDEEHDESYKSDSKPRYNTKDLALYISKLLNIKVILGSATPSLNTFHKIPFYRLKETFFETIKTINFDDSSDSLSLNILNKIKQTLDEKSQVIIFLPTRANFKYQVCTTCGKAVDCPFCSVSMSLHKNSLALKCHYCGYSQKIPEFCPSCNSGIIHSFRVGTAQIEEELKLAFPQKVIKRFDRDEVKSDKQLREILDDFNDEKIDILVGTQMLSKGHDYHNVKLAVVLGIDSILRMNSYKARERALSLLIQISGRSGRKGSGEVIVQTQNEEFFSHYLNGGDYKEFLEDEVQFREELYPPYLKLAKVIFSHQNGIKAKEEMEKYEAIFKKNCHIEIIGAKEAPIFKIANKYRYEMLLRSSNTKSLLQVLHSINSPLASIDMDTLY